MESLASVNIIDRAFELGAIQIREEISAFVDFLRPRNLRNVMEIGSESGGTFYLWCQIAAMGGLKISLDKPDGESGSWLYKEPEALAKRTALFQSFAPRVKVVTGDSHDPSVKQFISDLLRGDKLDFLFIDGDHSYEGVRADYEMYKEFVGEDGVIAFHDIQHLGPRALWKELTSGHPVCVESNRSRDGFTFNEFNSHQRWAGIGIIQV